MDSWLEANRALWDELVGVHVRAPGTYDIEGFKSGRSTLRAVEVDEVGDVEAKRPGGFFYIVEQHPAGNVFTDRDGKLVAGEPYFDVGPFVETTDGSYADRTAILQNKTSHEWQHPLSDIINALVGVSLRIEFLHEFPFCMFQRLPSMVKGDDGWWRVPGREDLPFLFSLKASKG